jgi:hypothetical protein
MPAFDLGNGAIEGDAEVRFLHGLAHYVLCDVVHHATFGGRIRPIM